MNSEKKDVDWREFLLTKPPGTQAAIRNLVQGPNAEAPKPFAPDLDLWCDSCQSTTLNAGQCSVLNQAELEGFPPVLNNKYRADDVWYELMMRYLCRECHHRTKLYLIMVRSFGRPSGEAFKAAETPPFAPSTPSRFVKLIGPDRDLFLQGRRAEIAGLGIGAFAYYRRVVENQKTRLLDAILQVGRKSGIDESSIRIIESSKKETQFSKAIENVKDAIPDVIRINGHNPLTLLHGPPSAGIHDRSDDECLELATSIREVLFAMAERIDIALKERKSLDVAINKLLNPNT